jgi:hypothetical protein
MGNQKAKADSDPGSGRAAKSWPTKLNSEKCISKPFFATKMLK